MKRIDVNRKILEIIADKVEKYPDYRFIQLLWAMDLINAENGNIEDRFYEESDVTLNKINFLFVVANNIDYSSATHATCLEEKKAKKSYWKVPSKKTLNLSDEQIKIVKEEVKKYVEKIKVKERNENVETQEE